MRFANSDGSIPPYKLKIEVFFHHSEVALAKSTTISKKPPTEATMSPTEFTPKIDFSDHCHPEI